MRLLSLILLCCHFAFGQTENAEWKSEYEELDLKDFVYDQSSEFIFCMEPLGLDSYTEEELAMYSKKQVKAWEKYDEITRTGNTKYEEAIKSYFTFDYIITVRKNHKDKNPYDSSSGERYSTSNARYLIDYEVVKIDDYYAPQASGGFGWTGGGSGYVYYLYDFSNKVKYKLKQNKMNPHDQRITYLVDLIQGK